MKAEGKVWKFGDNIDTDGIIPARYLNTSDPDELAEHCMEDADREFASSVQNGDIIVAGKNFGCGSSREHAPIAIKAAGVSVVIAESFARIFYRNSFNIGLPIIELENTGDIKSGDMISVDFEKGLIKEIDGKKEYEFIPYPEFMKEIVKNGLMEYVKKKIKSVDRK